jgi:hypothetical protein
MVQIRYQNIKTAFQRIVSSILTKQASDTENNSGFSSANTSEARTTTKKFRGVRSR